MKPTKDQCDQKDKMPSFKMPTSEQEIYALQIATTQFLNDYFAGMTDRRLQARGIEPSTVKDPDDRKRMASIPSEVTRCGYLKTGTRLLKNVPPEADVWTWTAEKSSSKGAWYKNRASLQCTLVARIKESKQRIDVLTRAIREGKGTPELIAEYGPAFAELVDSANQLQAMPEGRLPGALTGDGKTKRPRQTKARSLRGLPDNWRETVAAMMPKPVRICWLTQCLTGARPAEIAKGVRVTVDDGKLILIVSGAKVRKGHSGQEERTLMYDASAEMARLLVGLLDATQLTIGTDRNANAYRSAVAYYGKKAFPERQGTARISAYSARHAFKEDLKAAQWPAAMIAMAMGHVSTESSSYYGGARKRSGAVSPISVTATNKVKVRKPYSSDRTNTLSPRVKLKVKPSK
jgi:integrase